MNATVSIPGAGDPAKLAALCELWQADRCELALTLYGQSMRPGLPPGTRLRLRCGPERPGVGEIAAYRREGALIVHRLAAVTQGPEGERLVFKGDGNAEPDRPVPPEAVVGIVVEFAAPSRFRQAASALRRRLQGRAAGKGARP
jgi:hypothetical protein